MTRDVAGPKSQLSELQPTRFEQLIFYHAFSLRKSKRTAKFDGLEEDEEGGYRFLRRSL